MSSLIPKISVGIDSRKYRRNQSCLVHGTSEIGFVFPTYARNYINDASISIGTRSRVMLSSMFVPTMGQMDVRHYHCFIPWNRCWAPHDAFQSQEPYAFSGMSAVPSHVPKFKAGEILVGLFQKDSLPSGWNARGNVYQSGCSFLEWIQSGALNVGLTCQIYYASPEASTGLPGEYHQVNWTNTTGNNSIMNDLFCNLNTDIYGYQLGGEQAGSVHTIIPSMLRTSSGDYFIECKSDASSFAKVTGLGSISAGSRSHIGMDYINNLSFPTIDNCDFCYEIKRESGSQSLYYMVCFNFNGAIKRLRNIFLGLGYSFNPYDMESDSILKLFAYYRAWFSLFAVTRDINFNDTACAKLYRLMSDFYCSYDLRIIGAEDLYTNLESYLYTFFKDLCDLTYTCPADYFTSSVPNAASSQSRYMGVSGGDSRNPVTDLGSHASVSPNSNVSASGIVSGSSVYVNALSIEIARRLLTWVNKNTIVGKKIADILYSRFGKIQTNDDSSEGVYKIGVDTVPITIDQIFNQTSSDNSAPLGERSGIGQGGKRAPKHSFTTPAYGVLITLTAVVPEMGYFQGKLRENSDGVNDFLELPDTAYDAVGWQNVRYNELVADRQFARYLEPDSYGTSLGNYGKQMRYSHYKVGFNRVLGDVSLPHMRDSMLAYTLDRYFDPRDYNLPVNNPVTARRGDIGGTNRIFDVVSPTDDHIIYQVYFDVSVNDRLKPLGLSYDTILENDDKTADFGHQ